MTRRACEILAEMRGITNGKLIGSNYTLGKLVKELQLAVNNMVNAYDARLAAYETGSHVRCSNCEWNGGMELIMRCKHCGKEKVVKP